MNFQQLYMTHFNCHIPQKKNRLLPSCWQSFSSI